eukprot:360150-Pelagomonas_calceolata.AAC.16
MLCSPLSAHSWSLLTTSQQDHVLCSDQFTLGSAYREPVRPYAVLTIICSPLIAAYHEPAGPCAVLVSINSLLVSAYREPVRPGPHDIEGGEHDGHG